MYGKEASYVGSEVSKRMRSNSIVCSVIRCSQPAQLWRLTCHRHLIGTCDEYSCLTPHAHRFILEMTHEYQDVQGIFEHNIQCTMSKQIDSLISSGIRELSDPATVLSNSTPLSVPIPSNRW